MGKIPSRDIVARIVDPLSYRDDGMTLSEIVAVFPEPPPRARVERWLADLVAEGLLSHDRTKKPSRYFTEEPAYPFTTWAARASNAPSSGDQGNPEPATKLVDSGAESGTPEAVIPTAIKSGIKTDNGSAASTTEPAIKSSGPAVGRPQTAILNSENGSEVSSQTRPSSPGERDGNGGVAMPGDVPLAGSFAAPDEGFSRIFDDALLAFVVGALPPTSAMARLQGLARQAVSDPAKRSAFVEYGMKRLSRLTVGECARHGIEPQQYEIWRRQYFRVVSTGSTSLPASSPPSAASATSDKAPKPPADPGQTAATKPATENEVVAQKLVALINAALPSAAHAPASSSTDSEDGDGGVIGPKAVTRSAPTVVSKATLNTVAKVLVDALGRFIPGGVNPATRTALIGIVGLLLMGLLHVVGATGWILAAGAAAVGAVLLVGWIAVHFLSPSKQRNEMQSAATANDPTAAPSAPPSATNTRRTAVLLSIVVVFAAVAGLGLVLYLKARMHPSPTAIGAHLVADFAPIPVRVAALDVTYGQTGNAGGQVTFRAVIETTEPLYRRLETDAYLRTHAPAEIAAIDAAAALLQGPSGDRLRSAAGPAPVPDCHTLLLLSTQTPQRQLTLPGDDNYTSLFLTGVL